MREQLYVMQRCRLTCRWSGERELVDVGSPYLRWSGVRPDANDGEGLEKPGQYTKEKGVCGLPRCRQHKHECNCDSGPLHREFKIAPGAGDVASKGMVHLG